MEKAADGARSALSAGLCPNVEDDAEQAPPRVTDSPRVIWLQYGDIERDCTHAECYRDGDVTWCDDKQFESDVMYVNGAHHERILLALAGLHDALKRRHYGRMPDEVQQAYDEAAAALGA